MLRGSKKYLNSSIILLKEDTKICMIHLYIPEIFVILQLKIQQGDVLEQDIELCSVCCFPVTIHIAGWEEPNFLCKFPEFQNFMFVAFLSC
jgi:hypothetical protein